MDIITDFEELHRYKRTCVIALGTFDGLHRGHLDVINTARKQAKLKGAQLAVFTFSSHPLGLIAPEKLPTTLLADEQKRELMRRLGVEVLLDIPFTPSLADTSPEEFIDKLCLLDIDSMVVGENFTYGKNGAGNVLTLKEAAGRHGFNLSIRDLCREDGRIISSTEIRRAIISGDVASAAKMLGRCYSIGGTVIHGNQRGRLLGFPTANMKPEDMRVTLPAGGVYAVFAELAGKMYGGMTNIGLNPTFGDVKTLRLETNIFDYVGDAYGEYMRIFFVRRIREEKKFAQIEQLKQALLADKEFCCRILKKECCGISL